MQKSVADCGLVDIARLRVGNTKMLISAMFVRLLFQIAMESKNVSHEMSLEFLHVGFFALPFQKFAPCFKEIFDRDDILVRMIEPDKIHIAKRTPPPKLLPVLERAKRAYCLWSEYHPSLPKSKRYTLGERIDGLLVDIIEAMSAASFLPKGDKEPHIRVAIRKLDTLKILLLVAWESKSLDTKKYVVLSEVLDEIGKQVGGWYGQLKRETTP